ncbi:DNA polymerase III subunit gamma/tau [Acaryochloris marina]|uniref:DNA polymerase III subunit gamma/tau n=1 Tax=Acaryochloris marina (strain MBIC 11017) TaxID=329726 RepID=B0C201_ACAM1|nr:DNA polymerase III subunit gamma/tau [Acaryochloris marina]ABW27302.1 DNA polymerase III gamma and tau subunits [Acaryochloris marina MBIC11017]
MAYEPLHHKYRPQVFADLVGQDAIATTLTNAIEFERIAPAYLFTGPRGTGKTSSARILAKSLNCLNSQTPTQTPCGTCSVCQEVALGTSLDVIEIDAASNTGVDNIRDLIERAQFAPVQCRFKIYCLDEVHMLSTAAFNALLKTLEEPPDRVVFILATTDPQRVLPTIISRCQRFDFRRIALDPMIQHLTHIAEQESIAITPTAVELIAQVAQGGLRDAESLLDQLSLLSGEIDNTQVWDLVGSVPEQALLALLQAIIEQQPALMVERTHALLDRGREPLTVLQNLAGFYRDLLIAKTAPTRRDLVAITAPTWTDLCQLAQQFEVDDILAKQQHLRNCETQIKNSTQPRLWLEVSLLGLLPGATQSTDPQPILIQITSQPLETATQAPEPVSAGPAHPVPPSKASAPTQPSPVVDTPQPAPQGSFQAPPVPEPQVIPQPEAHSPEAEDLPNPLEDLPEPLEDLPTPLEETPDPLPSLQTDSIPHPALPQPEPTPAPLPPPSAPPAPVQVDLTEVWQQLLQSLNLPSRALLKEHGQLLYWQGREVRIGIRKTLLRLAQGKVQELEETFEKCFNRKVKVTLKVLTEEQMRAKPASPSTSSAPPSVSAPSPVSAPPPNIAAPQPIATPPAPIQNGHAAPQTAPQKPSEAPPTWQSEDETTSAAKSFAQFFNGAFVDIDPKEPEQTEAAKSK